MITRSLLITVSENPSYLHGVRFAAQFYRPDEPVVFTILYIAPQAPDFWSDTDIRAGLAEAERWTRKHEAMIEDALGQARDIFLQRGFRPETVRVMSRDNRIGRVREIALAAEEGSFDAVVLGRRGLARLEEFFEETVSGGMLSDRVEFPIWVCRRPEMSRRNVLLCVDGSKAGLCAADHVGYMLGPDSVHEVTVCHVVRPGRRDFEEERAILANAVKMLQVNDVPDSRIRTRIIEASNVPGAIMHEAGQGGYAAVAIGRTGSGRGVVREMLFGSVSVRLARELVGAALWVCKYPCRI